MSYKLYYFDGSGRAEIIRLVFVAAGVKFEDVRFSYEEWVSKYKAIAPTGVVPFLEDAVSGKTLVQSGAIARLMATRHGLMSSDPIEYYKIERILHQLKDIQEAAVPSLFGPQEHRPAAKKEFLEAKAPSLLANLALFLQENHKNESGFAVGKRLTLADVSVINMADFVERVGAEVADLLAKYPEISAHRKHVLESSNNLADYIAARKPTPF